MAIPLDTHTPVQPERKPGDFRRRGIDGPPIVASLTKTRQPTGLKADLVAKCAERGIEVPAKAKVADLKALLGVEPADETYGRPSGFGAALDNPHALIKWKERQVALGIAMRPELLDRMAGIDAEAERETLDGIVAQAHEAAGSSIAADRGTHVHLLTERHDRGESFDDLIAAGVALGIPEPLQRQAVAKWAQFRAAMQLTALHVEVAVVHDGWRLAGTADRIDVCAVDIETPFGHVIEAGTPFCGDVKGLALDTPLPTPTGWTTMGAVEVGDQVIGSDGRPCNVLYKSAVRSRPCFRISFDDGTTVVADDEHRWLVDDWWTGGRPAIRTTQELFDNLEAINTKGTMRRQRVMLAGPLDLPELDLPIDPYVLGIWLADGTHTGGGISKPINSGIWQQIERRGYELGKPQIDKRTGCCTRTVLGLRTQLRIAGLLGFKHIPEKYLRGSIQQRLDLLRGLMDGDGSTNKARGDRVIFYNTNKALSAGVYELATSLGERAHQSSTERTGFGVTVTSHDVEWAPLRFNPFAAEKAGRTSTKRTGRNHRRLISRIDSIDSVPTQCIAVDSPDSTYLCTESMLVTHNTSQYRTTSNGQPMYWLKYGPQVVAYADGVPYDVDADVRGQWGAPIHTSVALIYNYDLTRALDGEVVEWLAIPVDLTVAREGARIAVEATEFARRTDMFGAPISLTPAPRVSDDAPSTAASVEVEQGAGSTEMHGSVPVDPALELANSIAGWGTELKKLLAVEWPVDVPTPARVRRGEATWTPEQLVRAQAAVNEIVGPFDDPPTERQLLRSSEPVEAPETIDDGDVLDAEVVDGLVAAIKASDARVLVNAWLRQAADAGCSWQPRNGRRERHYEIARAAFHCAQMPAFDDDELVRFLLAEHVGDVALMPSMPVGVLMANLTIDEARKLADAALAVCDGEPIDPDTGANTAAPAA